MKNKAIYFLYFVFGALLPFLGILSIKAKLFFILSLIFINLVASKKVKIISSFPLFFVILSIDYIFDLYFFSKESVFSFTNRNFLFLTIEYLSFLLIFNFFFIKKDGENNFISGVITSLSSLSFVFLIDEIFNYNLFSQPTFWENQGREAILFSDPNAYGVFFALISPFFISKVVDAKGILSKLFFTLIFLISIFSATYSGSRTMVIGLVVSTFFYIVFKFNISKKILFIPLLMGAIFVSVVTYNSNYFCSFFHKSANRICKSLDANQISKSLYSRSVFTKLNLGLIKDYPYTGVGFNKFEDRLSEYKKKLNIDIGNWSDNPNNFYLGIISELGLIGFLFFLIGISSFRFKLFENNFDLAKKSSIISLTVMLLTGPHFNFIEITVFCAWLISSSLFTKRSTLAINSFSLIVIIIYAFMKFPLYNEREFGLYSYEKNDFGNFQWTRKKFKKLISCRNDNFIFSFRALNPDIATKPLKLSYIINDYQGNISFSSSKFNEIKLSCTEDSHLIGELSRDFKPSQYFPSKDGRKLGIQLYSN